MGIVYQNLSCVADERIRILTTVHIPSHVVSNRFHFAHNIRDAQGRIIEYLRGLRYCVLTNIILEKCKEEANGHCKNHRHNQDDGKSESKRQPLHDIIPRLPHPSIISFSSPLDVINV